MPSVSSRLLSASESPPVQQVLAAFQSPETSKRMALFVNIALITLVSWLVARLTWQLIPSDIARSQSMLSTSMPVGKRAEKSSMANVAMLHLMGESKQSAINQSNSPIQAPDTHLQLALHGVFACTNSELSLAIIAEKKGKDKTYRQGDSLPNGVLLHKIYADRVILSRNGKFETLRLIREQANIDVRSSSSLPAAGELHHSARIDQLKRNYRRDPQSLWKRVRITPVMKNGQIAGYRFNYNDRKLMKDLGLRSQDVITAINGVAVTNTASLMEMMGGIGSMNMLNLTLRRDGKTKDITIEFN